MKSRKLKLSDDQIEQEVLATREDSSRWEVLPFVPASSSPRPAWMLRNKHLELAAKFHVLSVLHRLEVEANLALAQQDNIDITVLGREGQAITIDVKIVEGAREWQVDEFSPRKHHYVVVVVFSTSEGTAVVAPRAYVFASQELRKFLSRRKLRTVSLDVLSRELAALEAWQLIISEHAA